jgi:hypothetical protein
LFFEVFGCEIQVEELVVAGDWSGEVMALCGGAVVG